MKSIYFLFFHILYSFHRQKNNDSNLAKKNYDKIDSNDANLAKKNDDKIDSKFSKTDNISYIEMVKKVYQLEGISGFYKFFKIELY